jgi:hypothetical protein
VRRNDGKLRLKVDTRNSHITRGLKNFRIEGKLINRINGKILQKERNISGVSELDETVTLIYIFR